MKDAQGHGSNSRGALAVAAQHRIPTGHLKVQRLALDRAGPPWATVKSVRNRTVAEHIAKYMRTDGAYMRIHTK